jgi:hypothetical protein
MLWGRRRNYSVELDHPVTSKLTYAGAPIKAEGFFKMRRTAAERACDIMRLK